MNFYQKVAVGITDVIILLELCISLAVANLDPENLTPVFFKMFFSMFVPTIVIAVVVVKRLRLKEAQPIL